MIISNIVETNKLWCSVCDDRFAINDIAFFEIEDDTKEFVNVYCYSCGLKDHGIWGEDINELEHPYSYDSLGQ